MDMRSPNRLSDRCRTRVDNVLAGRGRPFSGSDKYLEEYKHRAEPLQGECLSFVFVTLCDRDLQQHSLRCAVMCAHVSDCTSADTGTGNQKLPPSYLDSI